MSEATHAYIGRARCGCVRSVTVDLPDEPDWVGRTVAETIRSGLTVEHVPLGSYTLGRCPHQDTPDARAADQAAWDALMEANAQADRDGLPF